MKIVIIGLGDRFLIDFSKGIAKKNIQVPYIVSSEEFYEIVKNSIPNSKILGKDTDFLNLDFLYNLNINNKYCLSEKLIKEFSEAQNIFISITDRFSYFPLSVRERKKIYLENLLYWYSFFKENKIDCVFFDNSPHFGYDNIVYFMAKRFGIKTVYPEKTSICDRVIFKSDYEKLEKVPKDFMKDSSESKIKELINKNLLIDIRKEYASMKRARSINKQIMVKNRTIAFLNDILEQIKNTRKQNINKNINVIKNKFRFLLSFFRYKSVSALHLNKKRIAFKIYLLNFLLKRELDSLRTFYDSNTYKVNYKRRYVFFALHFQPERTTLPLGGSFDEQFQAINIISKAIPKDWTIYVKEHPRQFPSNLLMLKNKHFRIINDYEKLLILKNVKFVSISESSVKLIKQAQFSATISGSVGWQTLLQNKSCMVFGVPWYAPCNSCYVVKSLGNCKNAIKEIKGKSKKEVSLNMYKFILFMQKRMFISSDAYRYAMESDISYNILVKNLVLRFYKLLNQKRNI